MKQKKNAKAKTKNIKCARSKYKQIFIAIKKNVSSKKKHNKVMM
jgi:hypothetical protein